MLVIPAGYQFMASELEVLDTMLTVWHWEQTFPFSVWKTKQWDTGKQAVDIRRPKFDSYCAPYSPWDIVQMFNFSDI